MKKTIISLVTSLAVFSLAVTFSVSTKPVQAQTVNCPAGYTCTPVAPQFSGCPVGYTCTPVTVTSTPSPVSNPISTNSQCYTWSDHLGLGDRNASVVALQTFLIAKGFDIPLISHGGISKGYFGPSTASALAKYQSSVGISPTGIFGAVTRSNINSNLCSSNNSPQSPATTASPVFSVTGTPTFTQTVASTDQLGNQVMQYTASFNVQVTANGSNLTLGLPSSSYPFISATSPFISIYKNGVADSLSNYTVIVSYTQPTNTTLSTNGTSFIVPQNQTFSIPVTLSFQVKNPGANVYGIQLNQVEWSSSSLSNQMTLLTGANLGAGNSVPTQPTCASGQTWNGSACVVSVAQSSIQIISPTSGQTVSQGSNLNIQWQHDTSKAGQNVTLNIRLLGQDSLSGGAYTQIVQYIVNGTTLNIPQSVPSDGQWSWTIPSTVPAGQYEIQVIESLINTAGLPTDIAVSSPFNITANTVTQNPTCPSGQTWSGSVCTVQIQPNSGQPFVSIISPNGGETYTPGQVVPISFSTNLTSQQAPNGFNIFAYYGGNSTDVGSYSSGVPNIVMNWTGGSPYNWTVPSTWSAGNYVIYIVPATLASGISSSGLFAFGNSYFTISSGITNQNPTCSSGQTWNGSSCVTTQTQTSSPVITNVSVDKSSYNIGDSYTVTWNLANAPTNGFIGIALENQSGVRVYNIVNTCGYVSNCVNIPAVSGAGTYTGTIPTGVGSIGSSVSNGQYKFEVELIANGAYVTDGVSSQTVSIPLGVTTPPVTTNGTPQVSISGSPTLMKNVINANNSGNMQVSYTSTFNVSVQAVGGPVTLGLPSSSFPAFVATQSGFQILKNGAPDTTISYNPVVSYLAPNNVVISSDGTSFTIPVGATVTIPVTYTFTATNPGANVYSAQLLSMGWSSGSQINQTTPLGGSTWQTSSAMSSDNASLTASIWDAIKQYYTGQ